MNKRIKLFYYFFGSSTTVRGLYPWHREDISQLPVWLEDQAPRVHTCQQAVVYQHGSAEA